MINQKIWAILTKSFKTMVKPGTLNNILQCPQDNFQYCKLSRGSFSAGIVYNTTPVQREDVRGSSTALDNYYNSTGTFGEILFVLLCIRFVLIITVIPHL